MTSGLNVGPTWECNTVVDERYHFNKIYSHIPYGYSSAFCDRVGARVKGNVIESANEVET